MESIEKYYENTKDALPHENVEEFVKIESRPGEAIDLGCGTGRDTVFLIKNKWKVLAIDREDTKEIISNKLNAEEHQNFRFIAEIFEKIKLEKNDLIVANFSIPFCSKEYFNELWNEIVQSITNGRLFCRKFIWNK